MQNQNGRNLMLFAVVTVLISWGLQLQLGRPLRRDFAEPPRIGSVREARELRNSSSSRSAVYYPESDSGQVIPASVNMTMAMAQTPDASQANTFAISRVEQNNVKWDIERDGQEIRLVAFGTIVIKGTGANAGTLKVNVEGSNVATTQPDGSWSATVPVSRPGVVKVEIKKEMPTGNLLRFVNVIAPTEDDNRILEPVINKVSNNALRMPADLPASGNIRVYGGYLSMSGLRVQSGTRLQFAVFDKDGKFVGITIPSLPVNPRPDASWDAELDIKFPPEMAPAETTTGFVRAIAFSATDGLHRYSKTQVNFQVAPEGTPSFRLKISGAPTITDKDGGALPKSDSEFLSKEKRFIVAGAVTGADAKLLADSRIVVLLNNVPVNVLDIEIKTSDQNKWKAAVEVNADNTYTVQAATVLGRMLLGDKSDSSTLRVRASGPRIVAVAATNAALEGIKITFDEKIKLVDSSGTNINLDNAFILNGRETKNTPKIDSTVTRPSLDSENSLILPYKGVLPDVYTFTVKAELIKNLFGTQMAEDFKTQLFRPLGAEEPTISRGITGPTGPFVPFGEYTKPRPFIDGFNPSDHVETRVSRLYYFRDAHRVAQIVNRDAKSYNRAAVEMQQQLANKAHQIADQATDDRRLKERNAVQAAQTTREAEQELQEAQQSAQNASNQAASAQGDLQRTDSQLFALPQDDPRRAQFEANASNLTNVVGSLESVATAARNRAQAASNKVQQLRAEEAQAREQWQAAIAVEDRAREEQFRREVAAAHADPDTYAPGAPESEDPVQQVSVSVIGEGLIQLRGPIKGINIIRTMINQIDAPVGQVRVGVHTVQINGEKGDRMEVVAGKIQRYIDHSRFLTLQSAEMLRKAIVQVAAQRAMESGNVPGLSQAERDRSYLYSFFGEDFIRELETMDSEFLATGNKLLSIHSMDSTSLASAMFIMALAKNSTRMQIQQTFEEMMARELPSAERNYFEAGVTCDGKHKLFDKHCNKNDFTFLSQNARFQSIRGMFNVDIAEDDTMTPMQREFIRLAQIFKSRLIVEMELKQRVMERSVIEERLGNREKDLQDAREKEEAANQEKQKAQKAVRDAQKGTLVASRGLLAVVQNADREADASRAKAQYSTDLISARVERIVDAIVVRYQTVYESTQSERNFKTVGADFRQRLLAPLSTGESIGKRFYDIWDSVINRDATGKDKSQEAPFFRPIWPSLERSVMLTIDKSGMILFDQDNEDQRIQLETEVDDLANQATEIQAQLESYRLDYEDQERLNQANMLLSRILSKAKGDEINNSVRIRDVLQIYAGIAAHRAEKLAAIYDSLNCIVTAVSRAEVDFQQTYQNWLQLEQKIFAELSENERKQSEQAFNDARTHFRTLQDKVLDFEFAQREAEASRRPLDHKKFLDMLVDEMEDKYIELLEGTRAHTANIDAYIKRLITSLDDDFNTQFYYPTFRKVREASQLWDVQMGQVETTNVLANNRAFAKVSPEATMEFDLPKRDILITEAMNGAKAMMDDVGALAQDPTFLAMAQMKSGAPTSSPMAGATGGQATVRNVLPGLSTDTAESVMGQQGPGGSKFGSAMEALIPDPAIYKFETGTGWEIRPVIQPDGQALVFHFNYMYTTNIREPVRADEKHLGRVKRHFVDTDVQLSNFELREISRYTVALKASRTSRGVPLLEDIPIAGALFRPQPSDESSLQQNVILGQATIFPTVFDLMGLRWAPVVSDLDPLRLSNDEFIVRNRHRAITNRVFDHSSSEVDKFLRIPEADRRMDLYRSQETIPSVHPNGYDGPGANLRESQMQEGYDPTRRQESQFIPGESIEGSLELQGRRRQQEMETEVPMMQPKTGEPSSWDNSSSRNPARLPVTNAGYQRPSGAANPQLQHPATQPTSNAPTHPMRPANPPVARTAQTRPQQMPQPATRAQSKK